MTQTPLRPDVRSNHEDNREDARLAAVARYEILDTPADAIFDDITALAAQLLHVPVALITLVDRDRIWFKSHHGTAAQQVDREPGLCATAVFQDEPWIVTDALADPRTRENSLVTGEFGLRFYAGVPLRTHDGLNIGMLCVVDFVPRELTEHGRSTLRRLANLVMSALEASLITRRRYEAESEQRQHAEAVATALQRELLPATLPPTPGLDIEARYHVANCEQVGGDFYDVLDSDDGVALVVGDVCGKGREAAAVTAKARWALRTLMLRSWTPAGALDDLNQVLVRGETTPDRYCTVALARARVEPGGEVALTVSLGGHPRPLALRADGTLDHVGRTAPIVGYFPDASFLDSDVTLAPGESVILFTDGMLEAVQGHGTGGDDALVALLAPLAGRPAAALADHLDNALRHSALCDGSLHDDAAYLVVRAAA